MERVADNIFNARVVVPDLHQKRSVLATVTTAKMHRCLTNLFAYPHVSTAVTCDSSDQACPSEYGEIVAVPFGGMVIDDQLETNDREL